jgi:hypothetical protein
MTDPLRSLQNLTAVVDQSERMAQQFGQSANVPPVAVEALGGGLRVIAAPPGFIKVEIREPRVLQRGSDEIGREVGRAANEALHRLRHAMTTAAPVDAAAAAEEFARISARGSTSFQQVLDSVMHLQHPAAR